MWGVCDYGSDSQAGAAIARNWRGEGEDPWAGWPSCQQQRAFSSCMGEASRKAHGLPAYWEGTWRAHCSEIFKKGKHWRKVSAIASHLGHSAISDIYLWRISSQFRREIEKLGLGIQSLTRAVKKVIYASSQDLHQATFTHAFIHFRFPGSLLCAKHCPGHFRGYRFIPGVVPDLEGLPAAEWYSQDLNTSNLTPCSVL